MALLSDLENLNPLLLPLALPREVAVISDQDLVSTVAKNLERDAKAAIAPVPGVAGSSSVVPAEVLMELARASAPPGLPDGLEDFSLQWAWIRYCWAFEEGAAGSGLKISEVALAQTRHHKVVTSEQLGIGFAITLTRAALGRLYPGCRIEVHDADVVIDGGPPATWGLGPPVSDLRPDYFVEILRAQGRAGAPPSALYVLECKGTFSNHHYDQMRKGMRQINSVSNWHGGTLPGIVCATSFNGEQAVTVRMLDPGDEPEFFEPSGADGGEAVFRGDGEGFQIGGEPQLRRELAELRRASVLSFAGAYESAREILPQRARRLSGDRWPRQRERVRPLRDRESRPRSAGEVAGGREIHGVDASFSLIDGSRLAVTTAVDDRVLRAATGELGEDLETAQEEFASELARSEQVAQAERRRYEGDDSEWVPNVETESRDHLRVISNSGEVLDFRIS
jgi:hypothetical protein